MSRLTCLSRALVCALILLGTPAAALATPIAASSLVVDQKIGQLLLSNSGDTAERDALRQLTGIGDLVLSSKVDVDEDDAHALGTSSLSTWMISDLAKPGYFALKFGIGGTSATADTFFFRNIGDLTQLVWTGEQVQFLTGGACATRQDKCNIERLSHYTTTPASAPPAPLPPVTPALPAAPLPPMTPALPFVPPPPLNVVTPLAPVMPATNTDLSLGQGGASGGGASLELNDVPEPGSLALLALGALAAAGTRRRRVR